METKKKTRIFCTFEMFREDFFCGISFSIFFFSTCFFELTKKHFFRRTNCVKKRKGCFAFSTGFMEFVQSFSARRIFEEEKIPNEKIVLQKITFCSLH